MASVHRSTFTQAVPAAAVLRTVGGVRSACWVDRRGRKVTAPLLADGRCQRTAPGRWYGVYRDHHGRQRKTPTFGSRTHALEAALRKEQKAKAVREGREPPDRPTGRVLFLDLVDDYTAALAVKGTSRTWADRVNAELRRLIARHALRHPGGVDVERLAARLEADRRAGPAKGERGHGSPYSVRTRNKWVVSLKGFGNWLRKTKRVAASPFDGLATGNVEVDRRRQRRALPVGEFAAVVTAARGSGVVVQGLCGPDRAILYTLAAYTGLRAGALLRLTPESFTWNGGVPSGVFSTARMQKNKDAHGVGIHPEIAGRLGTWLKTRTPGEPVFRGNAHLRTAEMLRHDLQAAGVPYLDAAGEVFDFHSLRVQTGSMLVAAGVPLVVTQKILDHSDPKLTANIYARFGGDLTGELARMAVPAELTTPSLETPLGTEPLRTPPKVGNPVNTPPPPPKRKPRKS